MVNYRDPNADTVLIHMYLPSNDYISVRIRPTEIANFINAYRNRTIYEVPNLTLGQTTSKILDMSHFAHIEIT